MNRPGDVAKLPGSPPHSEGRLSARGLVGRLIARHTKLARGTRGSISDGQLRVAYRLRRWHCARAMRCRRPQTPRG